MPTFFPHLMPPPRLLLLPISPCSPRNCNRSHHRCYLLLHLHQAASLLPCCSPRCCRPLLLPPILPCCSSRLPSLPPLPLHQPSSATSSSQTLLSSSFSSSLCCNHAFVTVTLLLQPSLLIALAVAHIFLPLPQSSFYRSRASAATIVADRPSRCPHLLPLLPYASVAPLLPSTTTASKVVVPSSAAIAPSSAVAAPSSASSLSHPAVAPAIVVTPYIIACRQPPSLPVAHTVVLQSTLLLPSFSSIITAASRCPVASSAPTLLPPPPSLSTGPNPDSLSCHPPTTQQPLGTCNTAPFFPPQPRRSYSIIIATPHPLDATAAINLKIVATISNRPIRQIGDPYADNLVMTKSYYIYKKDHNISDLEIYAMTSEDLIDAKLEAFEMCMENKLHALFVEFRLGRLLSSMRSQQGESLDHKENPPEK
ncbi:hypothetical protein B296_00015527 [Ensete ventricosum]|uniref:Uncharacterized protein n=1 Tax=Ensete ventricosum TaxID=4639 RepID=A0A426ZH70_ENSVE|nr:hypothetical protein B296_00015527 [Ensete ventricosum]